MVQILNSDLGIEIPVEVDVSGWDEVFMSRSGFIEIRRHFYGFHDACFKGLT